LRLQKIRGCRRFRYFGEADRETNIKQTSRQKDEKTNRQADKQKNRKTAKKMTRRTDKLDRQSERAIRRKFY
jgi:hypothetical protein